MRLPHFEIALEKKKEFAFNEANKLNNTANVEHRDCLTDATKLGKHLLYSEKRRHIDVGVIRAVDFLRPLRGTHGEDAGQLGVKQTGHATKHDQTRDG